MKRITIDKLKVYYKYHGDMDGFARSGHEAEKRTIDSDDWSFIDELIQNLELINSGPISEAFNLRILEELKDAADENAFDLLTKR
ncbi:hypothetical protein ACFS7Z_08290 [Pontibacter toksunensis]|uniref:Uncharacterized protein n=1 Tax=Pontibacter toksunensis TaxID=1332631 RepID=A0ABW6BSU8_9BACT